MHHGDMRLVGEGQKIQFVHHGDMGMVGEEQKRRTTCTPWRYGNGRGRTKEDNLYTMEIGEWSGKDKREEQSVHHGDMGMVGEGQKRTICTPWRYGNGRGRTKEDNLYTMEIWECSGKDKREGQSVHHGDMGMVGEGQKWTICASWRYGNGWRRTEEMDSLCTIQTCMTGLQREEKAGGCELYTVPMWDWLTTAEDTGGPLTPESIRLKQ